MHAFFSKLDHMAEVTLQKVAHEGNNLYDLHCCRADFTFDKEI